MTRNFPNVGVVEGQLSEDVVKNIWTVINEAREEPDDMKPELAGNISSSIRLDTSSPLLEEFRSELLPTFINNHIESFGPPWRRVMKEDEGFNLESFWVNFQKKHEFNPPHDHGGVYSFVIWMQIPTSFAEQRNIIWKKKQKVTWLCFPHKCFTKFFRFMKMTGKEYRYQETLISRVIT